MSDFTKAEALASWRELPAMCAPGFEGAYRYFQLLQDYNLKLNFYSRKLTPRDLWHDHVLDCAAGAPYFTGARSVLDLGTGGGLPGLVLATLHPNVHFLLCDKSPKKIHYLKQLTGDLGLHNVKLASAPQAESLRKLDAATTRAFGTLEKILAVLGELLQGRPVRQLHYKARRAGIEEDLAGLKGTAYEARVHPLKVPGPDKERHLLELLPRATEPLAPSAT